MAAMDGFDHLLNWKLKRGSHYFPGPDGGTCINEAALVAAGFEYQRIGSVHQMPACFSRPICALAMWLNDFSTDEQRQRLLPYVTRLSCADSPEVEQERADYIDRHTRAFLYGISFDSGLSILEGALAIGRQADSLAADEVRTRMDAARSNAEAHTPVPKRSLGTTIKGWLMTKAAEPAA